MAPCVTLFALGDPPPAQKKIAIQSGSIAVFGFVSRIYCWEGIWWKDLANVGGIPRPLQFQLEI